MNEVAAAALSHFNGREYERALEALARLAKEESEKGRPDDVKVAHNAAVATFFLSNLTEPYRFLEDLAKIKRRIEHRAEDTSDANDASLALEMDSYLLNYNLALVNLQLRQYATALAILENLFHNIEPIEEHLATKICFLLADAYLSLHLKEKVPPVISYLEKTFALLLRERDGEHKREGAENGERDPPQVGNGALSAGEFKYNLHLCKAKLYLQNKSVKSSKREIKMAIGTNHNFLTTFLKANLEYLRQNYGKSTKILSGWQWQKAQDKTVAPLYFNNLGCINFRLKKLNLSLFYFSKALKESESIYESERNLPSFSKNKKREILYNIGHQSLLTGNPELAFTCFQEAAVVLHRQPKVWIRLAECCISAHLKKLQQHNRSFRNSLVRKVAGAGRTRRVLLPTNKLLLTEAKFKRDPESSSDKAPPPVNTATLSLEYAAKCIRNALFLLSKPGAPAPAPPTSAASAAAPPPSGAVPPSSASAASAATPAAAPANPEEELLLQAALADGAYVALAMSNPVLALSYVKELLSKRCLDNYRYLGNIYAAEALCMLGRPVEAAQHLSPQALGLTGDSAQPLLVSPYSAEGAAGLRYALCINLAVVHILKDDLHQAYQCVQQALSLGSSTTGILLQVYLELRKGSTDAALHLLKVNGVSTTPLPHKATEN